MINWQGLANPQVVPKSNIIPLAQSGGGDDGIGDLLSGLQGLAGGFSKAFGGTSSQLGSQPMGQVQNQFNTPAARFGGGSLGTMDSSGGFMHGGPTTPTSLIFHDTAGPTLKSAIDTLHERGLSYNYIIDMDGSIHNLVPAGTKAYHAKGYNDGTVGISFVGGGGFGNVNPAQQAAAVSLSKQLKEHFPTINTFAGHRDRTNAGKPDPEGFDYSGFEKASGLKFEAGPGSNRYKYDLSMGNETQVVPYKRPQVNSSMMSAGPVQGSQIQVGQSMANQQSQGPLSQPAQQKTIEILKQYEGLESYHNGLSHARWDVNAYRVGHGSDTYTTADGKIHKVTSSTAITAEDADRDLQRRSQEFGATAKRQVGDSWNQLNPNVQAALTSVTYNYGSLPQSVVQAVKTGDTNRIAEAVANLGANKSRRKQEAELIRQGYSQNQQTNNVSQLNNILSMNNRGPMGPIRDPQPIESPVQQPTQQQQMNHEDMIRQIDQGRDDYAQNTPTIGHGINWDILNRKS